MPTTAAYGVGMQGDLAVTGHADADELLNTDPLALLIGMLLDQQVPMERAFSAPAELAERMGGRLDLGELAGADPDDLKLVFSRRPALHRFPGSMAARTQALCRHVLDRHGGVAEAVWTSAATGAELYANVEALPGFGEQKARIFVALLAKRLQVRPEGWEAAAGAYAQPGWSSVADIDGPEALAKVREHKKAMKARAKASGATPKARAPRA